MKSEPSSVTGNRFHAPIKHYHRTNTQEDTTWDEWIHGRPRKHRLTQERLRKWLKITGVLICLLAVVALAVALFIELS